MEASVTQPLVSVVTPFRNTAPYLAQCIESVLAQSYSRFEYILSDNCSTDGSREIAESYARRYSRIRLIRQPKLLTQVEHYNNALSRISESSQYCKIVQADDFIFPECLRRVVQAFEQSERIGLVSSYDLKGTLVRGSGYPYPASFLPGREMARLFLRTGIYVFGSPTTVSYRSSLVRNQQPFFEDCRLHEDTEKCMQILQHWDFGFVHQVLSYLRVDNESISRAARDFEPGALDWYIIVQRYAPVFLESGEAAARMKESKREYYRLLGREALRFRGASFWQYQKKGLETLGETLDHGYLARQIGRELLLMAANPGTTAMLALRFAKRKLHKTKPASSTDSFSSAKQVA